TTPPPPPPPPVPTLLSPGDGAAGVTQPVALSWTASTGATNYRVQVSALASFASLIYDLTNVTGTSTAVTGLTVGTTYYWHVSAGTNGVLSDFSTAFRFVVGSPPPPPAPPVLLSPANGAFGIGLQPTLSWTSSAFATSYEVQVATSPYFTGMV